MRENVEEPARTTADSLLRSFRNIHNQPVDAPICWLADRSPTANLAWGDIERMWLFRTLPGLLQLHHPQTVPRPIEFSSTERRQALAAGRVVLHPVPPRSVQWRASRRAADDLGRVAAQAAIGQ